MANQYADYRHKLRSGDILAYSHEGWKSFKDFKTQMVRVFTRSTYSHVGIVVEIAGRYFILENVVPYARLYPISMSGSFYHLPMNIDWTPELEAKAFSYIGYPYSQWRAIKAFFKNLGRGDSSECAALVWNVMYDANVYLGDRQVPDSIVLQAQLLGSSMHYVENKLGV